MWSFPTCDGSALQIPLVEKNTLENKSGIIAWLHGCFTNYTLPWSTWEVTWVWCPEPKCQASLFTLHVSSVLSISYYFVHTLPKDTQVLSVDPVRTGTTIYIFQLQNDSISGFCQSLGGASGDCLVHPLCSKQSQLELFSTPCLGFLLVCKEKKCKHECLCGQLKE